MAKKGKRILINLACSECKNQNYTTEKNKINDPERVAFNKFCQHCRKVTPHNEVKK
ncbi:MAG: 50S ribosomal protein L33 [bacterium]|nr:50S ribosomal protein L33 [bacterium]